VAIVHVGVFWNLVTPMGGGGPRWVPGVEGRETVSGPSPRGGPDDAGLDTLATPPRLEVSDLAGMSQAP